MCLCVCACVRARVWVINWRHRYLAVWFFFSRWLSSCSYFYPLPLSRGYYPPAFIFFQFLLKFYLILFSLLLIFFIHHLHEIFSLLCFINAFLKNVFFVKKSIFLFLHLFRDVLFKIRKVLICISSKLCMKSVSIYLRLCLI